MAMQVTNIRLSCRLQRSKLQAGIDLQTYAFRVPLSNDTLSQSCKRDSFLSPNPARNHNPEPGPTFIYETRYRPEIQIYWLSQDMRNCGE